jgi:hypothetical protein
MSTLKLVKIVNKLEARQAVTAEERDFVLTAQPISVPAPKKKKVSKAAKAFREFGQLLRGTQVLALYASGFDATAAIVEASETGQEIDWGSLGTQTLKDLRAAAVVSGWIAGIAAPASLFLFPPAAPVLGVMATLYGAEVIVLDAVLSGQPPPPEQMAVLAQASEQIPDERAQQFSTAMKDPNVQAGIATVGKAAGADKKAVPQVRVTAIPTVDATSKYNTLLARAKALLVPSKGGRFLPGFLPVLPGGFQQRPPRPGTAQAAGADAVAGGGGGILPLVAFAGAALLAVALFQRKRR